MVVSTTPVVKAMVVSVAKSRDMIPSGKVERGERKQTADDVSKVVQVMSKPRVGQSFGIILGDA
jgi:hypothetical protein